MQLTTKKKKMVSNIEGQNFTITANSKAFQILSDKLYTNKIKAVVRELSTNAYDAHVEAGKADEPFEVHLPNSLEPYFYIRDWGVGMSEEKVLSLYSSYFGSDKTGSNDFVGALGLGSKSPFAYTDSFTVESVYDGMKKVYTCYLNEEDIPSISKVTEMPTSEHNGVKVELGVENGNYSEWRRNAEIVFRPFPTKPRIIGGEGDFTVFTYPENLVFEGKDWKAYSGSRHRSGLIAIQGNIEYQVGVYDVMEIIREKTENAKNYASINDLLRSLLIVINFPIGKLDIAPSREALSMDTRTVNNLVSKLKKVYEEIQKEIQEQYFDDNRTLWEVVKNYYTVTRTLNLSSNDVKDITYNGKSLQDTLDMSGNDKLPKFFRVEDKAGFYHSTDYDSRYVPPTPGSVGTLAYDAIGSPKTKVFINDEDKPNRGIYKLKQNMRKYDFHALVIPEDYIKKLGINGELNKTSDLEYIKKPGLKKKRNSSSSSNNDKKFYTVLNGEHKNESFTHNEIVESNLYNSNSRVYYVTKYRKYYRDHKDNRREVISLHDGIKYLKELNIIDDDTPIVLIEGYEMNTKRFQKLNRLQPFFESMEYMLKKKYNNSSIIKQFGYKVFVKEHDEFGYHQQNFVRTLNDIQDLDSTIFEGDNEVLEVINRYEIKDDYTNSNNEVKILENLIYDFEYNVHDFSLFNREEIGNQFTSINILIKNIKKRYPVLQIIDTSKLTSGYYGYGVLKKNIEILKNILENSK